MKLHPNWKPANGYSGVVSDEPTADQLTGADDVKFYGGYLVAESVPPSLIPLISRAPAMRYLLEVVRDADDDCQRDKLPRTVPAFMRARIDRELELAGAEPVRPDSPSLKDREHQHFLDLLKLLDAVEQLDKVFDLSKVVYDVRDSEGLGWDGPKVTAAGADVATIWDVLKRAGRK